jgi:hypothetical protein
MHLPLRLTVREFATLIRLGEEAVRIKIRAGTIEAQGRPHLIPRRELGKFGVDLADADEMYAILYPAVSVKSTSSRPPESPAHCRSTTVALGSCGIESSQSVQVP